MWHCKWGFAALVLFVTNAPLPNNPAAPRGIPHRLPPYSCMHSTCEPCTPGFANDPLHAELWGGGLSCCTIILSTPPLPLELSSYPPLKPKVVFKLMRKITGHRSNPLPT